MFKLLINSVYVLLILFADKSNVSLLNLLVVLSFMHSEINEANSSAKLLSDRFNFLNDGI